MNSKDFRIGNLVYYHISDPFDDPSEYDVLETINHDDLRCFEQYEDNSEYSPILLNAEWIEKFGFVKEGRHYAMGVHQKLFSGLMKLTFNGKLQMWVFSIGRYSDITRVQYVHELQNLYYALTGEELQSSRLEKPGA